MPEVSRVDSRDGERFSGEEKRGARQRCPERTLSTLSLGEGEKLRVLCRPRESDRLPYFSTYKGSSWRSRNCRKLESGDERRDVG